MKLFLKYFNLYVAISLFCTCNQLFAQTNGIEEQIEHIDELCLNYELDSCLQLSQSLFNELNHNDPNLYAYLSELQLIIGNAFFTKGQYSDALNAYKQSLTFNHNDPNSNFIYNITLNINIGVLLTSMGSYNEAEKTLQNCLNSFDSIGQYPNINYYEIKLLLALSSIKGEQRKYEEEKIHLYHALEIVKQNEINWKTKTEVYLGLAINSGDLYDHDNELKYALEAEEYISQFANPNDPVFPRLYTTLANSYYNNQLYDKSLVYHHKCVSNYLNFYNEDHPELSIPYENIANCYMIKERFDLAHRYIDKALKIHYLNLDEVSAKFGQAYLVKLKILQKENNYTLVKQTIDTVLQRLAFSRTSDINYKDILSPYMLVEILNINTFNELEEYKSVRDSVFLNKAYQSNILSLNLIDSIDLYQIDETELLNSKDQYYETYEQAFEIKSLQIKNNNQNDHIYELISIIEKSKNALIIKSFNDELVRIKGGVPESLIDDTNMLESDYSKLMIDKQYVQDDSEMQELNKDLYEIKKKIWSNRRQISELVAKNNSISLDPRDVYKYAESDNLLIQYAQYNNQIIINVITHDTVSSFKVSAPNHFTNNVVEFKHMLSDPNSGNCKDLIELSNKLYHVLFPEELDLLLEDMSSLTIVPSGIMNSIPFEALVRRIESNKCHNQKFLINDFNINYEYLLSKNVNNDKNDGTFIGYAPISNTADNRIPGSSKEIAEIAKSLNGVFLSGKDANEDDVKKSFNNAGILHIATHTYLDDEKPMLSFLEFNPVDKHKINDQLYAIEIWNSKINADLVVLSSCSTADGKIQAGEGVLSLGRSFINAGVSSLLISLWEIADNSTSQIMIDFYKHLKNGESISNALRNSKLEWYNNDKVPKNMKHPFYWLGVIHIGNNEQIEIKSKKTFPYKPLIYSALALVAIIFLKKYRFKD